MSKGFLQTLLSGFFRSFVFAGVLKVLMAFLGLTGFEEGGRYIARHMFLW